MTKPSDDVAALFAAGESVALPAELEGANFGPDLTQAEAEAVRDCTPLPLNDVGNGDRVLRHFGQDLRFVGQIAWHVWDGKRFAQDGEIAKGVAPRVRRLAKKMGPLIAREVQVIVADPAKAALLEALDIARENFTPGDKAAEANLKAAENAASGVIKEISRRLAHAKSAGNSGSISNMLTEASVEVTVEADEMDADPWLLNCRNGTLRLDRWPGDDIGPPMAAVTLRDHSRDDLITKMIDADYDPTATCPKFDAFLAQIQPDPLMRAFLQRWFGYSAFGSVKEQALMYFHGDGANGKSVLTRFLRKLLGDYAAKARIQTFTGEGSRGGGDATPDLMILRGARAAFAEEPKQNIEWTEDLIKELTGGDDVSGRKLHADFVSFRPIAKITISGNHAPNIRGNDEGIWRRFNIVPFTVQIPAASRREMDALIDDFMSEASGVLNWLIAGAEEWAVSGLQRPDQVVVATNDLRRDSDPVGEFVLDICDVTGADADRTRGDLMRAAFASWVRKSGYAEWSGNRFARRMTAMAERWRHPETRNQFARLKSDGYLVWSGIKLREPFRTEAQSLLDAEGAKRLGQRPAQVASDD